MNAKPIVALLCASTLTIGALAEDSTPAATSADALAKQLSNPVASLISVPIQVNFDFGIGANDGWKMTTNVQPVAPFALNEEWNLISRTILPIIHQEDVVGTDSQTGLGDVVQSFFFSPKDPTAGGLIWGVGPVFLLPTATDNALGADRWGIGPTAVFLKQEGKATYGALVNHIVDFAGSGSADINATFVQPFYSYGAGGGVTYTINLESTYNWEASQWTIPVNVMYSKVTKVGDQLVSFGVGGRYYLEKPDGGPEWGLRFIATLLFPK
jgi:hypothetical protein